MSMQRERLHRSGVLAVLLACGGLALPVLAGAQVAVTANSSDPFRDALDAGSYSEAEVMAKQRLSAAIAEGRRFRRDTVPLYVDLAIVQHLLGDYEAATSNYGAAIDIIERQGDMLDLALEEPLVGRANAYSAMGRPDLAIVSLQRAVHVRQVNSGPHDLAQTTTLLAMAAQVASIGNSAEAAAIATRARMLLQRHRDTDPDYVSLRLLELGDIFSLVGDLEGEREAYADGLQLLSSAEPRNPGLEVELLVRTGESLHRQYFSAYHAAASADELPDARLLDESRAILENAVRMADSIPASDWRTRHRATLALGDFCTLIGDSADAREAYLASWHILSADDDRLALRRADLEAVVPLLQPLRDMPRRRLAETATSGNEADAAQGFITTSFTVDRRGRVTDVGLVEIRPERNDSIEAEMKRSLAHFVYRPRISNGFVVATPGQQFRYDYVAPAAAAANR